MAITEKQQNACQENVDSYRKTLAWFEKPHGNRPSKICNLCDHFMNIGCQQCPLGPGTDGCREEEGGLTFLHDSFRDHGSESDDFIGVGWWHSATRVQVQARLDWLLKKYKEFGIEIKETPR